MNRIDGVKAVTFDGDGTLWDFQKVMHHSLSYALKELESADPMAAKRLDIEEMISIRNRVAEELRGEVIDLEQIRLEAFRRTLEEVGRPNPKLASRLNHVYLKHRFEDIELFPDVIPTLEPLRQRYMLGLVSNGNSYPDRCGLQGVLRFIVFSQDHGVEKPDPRLFEIALQKAGCAKDEFLHVGDSLKNDVSGAMRAGIRCVWLNREGKENTSGLSIEYEIATLSQLLDLL